MTGTVLHVDDDDQQSLKTNNYNTFI